MTLKEAYELQRRELISLRAKAARLEKQVYAPVPSDQTEALERHVRNICERELRKFKRKQKQAVVFRSNSGAEYVCDALSIIETSRILNRNIFETVQSAFAK